MSRTWQPRPLRCRLCGTFTYIYTSGPGALTCLDATLQIKTDKHHFLGNMFGRLSCAFRCQLYTISTCVTFHITPFNGTTETVVASVFCWCNSALLCLTLSHITFCPLLAEDTEPCCVSQHRELKQNHWLSPHCTYTWSVYIYIFIYIHTIEEKKIKVSSPRSVPLQVFSNLTHGFPFTLLGDVEFLLRPSQDDRRPRGLSGRLGACARRTMRGERHTLMVESSLADSSSSWSAGLNATEFTTSSCAKRARQML